MNNKKPEMLSGEATWIRLNRNNNFETFFEGLKEYLKTKLKTVKMEGVYPYYSCGVDYHHKSMPGWKPFNNFLDYCYSTGYESIVAMEMIETTLGREIICECEIVNDMEAIKRARLQRSFGVDFGGESGH